MTYQLQLKAQAKEDITAAFDWYESQRDGLGKDFLNEIEKYLQLIEGSPKSFQQRDKQRYAIVRRFPFKIIFRIEIKTIVVLRVFHQHRNPSDLLNLNL